MNDMNDRIEKKLDGLTDSFTGLDKNVAVMAESMKSMATKSYVHKTAETEVEKALDVHNQTKHRKNSVPPAASSEAPEPKKTPLSISHFQLSTIPSAH